MRNESCAERIEKHLDYERQVFTVYMTDFDVYENGNDEQPPFHEYGLSLSTCTRTVICVICYRGVDLLTKCDSTPAVKSSIGSKIGLTGLVVE